MDTLGSKGQDLPCRGSIRSRALGKFISCQPDSPRLVGSTRAVDLVGCGLKQVPKVSAWCLASSPVPWFRLGTGIGEGEAWLPPPPSHRVHGSHGNCGVVGGGWALLAAGGGGVCREMLG